ncbi:hypothetical protein AB0M54_12925 [Actinoplanes sp. NPDC051470]|uniref:hypothetical protein n=1 Tax=Actinoplanes sp. NPDC051470 TaxID=3157224 RepID=UPI00344787DD
MIVLSPGDRPFRTHVNPIRDGSEVVSAVADRIRHDFYHRIGIEDLLAGNSALQGVAIHGYSPARPPFARFRGTDAPV